MSYLFNNVVKPSNSDAFSRTRVSDVFTIGEHTFIYDNSQYEMIFKLNGSGTYSHVRDEASLKLSVGTASGDYVISQSKLYHHYSPGKSQLILQTFNFGTASENRTKRVGYFDDRNGVYFQQSGDGILSFVERSYTSGTVSEISWTQSEWSEDRLDGFGASTKTLDISKIQLFYTDFQWLGAGRVRLGFVLDGELIPVHTIYHANSSRAPYWSNPSLPVRMEIVNTADATGTASVYNICSSVMSEGGYSEVGSIGSISTNKITISSTESSVPSLAIRLKNELNGYPNRLTVKLTQIDVLSIDNPLKYEVWKLIGSDSVTGGSWTSSDTLSGVEYNITGTTYSTSGGTLIYIGLIAASSTVGGQATKNPGTDTAAQGFGLTRKLYITQNYDSSGSDVFAVVFNALNITGGSCNCYASMQWSEF